MSADALDILCNDFRKSLGELEAALSMPIDINATVVRTEIIKDAQIKLFLRCASIFYKFCELIQIPGEDAPQKSEQEAWRILANRAYALKLVKESDFAKVRDILLYVDVFVECRGYIKSGPYNILLKQLWIDLHKLTFILKKLIVSIQSADFTPAHHTNCADCTHQNCL